MSQAKAAHAMRAGDAAEMKREAGRLESGNPRWIIVFGDYSRQFVAFPRFTVPEGTIVTARYPGALPARMRAVERGALPALAACQAPGRHATGASQPGEGRSGDVAGR